MQWIRLGIIVCCAVLPARLGAQQYTVELELQGRSVQGTPLAWSASDVMLLGRDGYLWNFAPGEVKGFRKVSDGFRGYSQADMRAQLAAEFGRGFDISGTGHYLVVHPAGQRDKWAARFEALYRSFVHYFTARGFQPQPPVFPLVAIVFPRQEDFLRYASQTGSQLLPGTLGYYSPTTNRILLYDVTAGRDVPEDQWQINAETIIHEAAHQSAFNTGVHGRYTMPPRWVVEGLGTMFEAPGVWDSRHFTEQPQRINRYRLQAFQQYLARRPKGSLANFVSSDRLFQVNPEAAYAEAWALTFFLVETRPRQYMQYLTVTGSKPAFADYRSAERLQDFIDQFGTDLAVLEAHFLRFTADLKP